MWRAALTSEQHHFCPVVSVNRAVGEPWRMRRGCHDIGILDKVVPDFLNHNPTSIGNIMATRARADVCAIVPELRVVAKERTKRRRRFEIHPFASQEDGALSHAVGHEVLCRQERPKEGQLGSRTNLAHSNAVTVRFSMHFCTHEKSIKPSTFAKQPVRQAFTGILSLRTKICDTSLVRHCSRRATETESVPSPIGRLVSITSLGEPRL